MVLPGPLMPGRSEPELQPLLRWFHRNGIEEGTVATSYPGHLMRRQAKSREGLPQREQQSPSTPARPLAVNNPSPMRFYFHIMSAGTAHIDTKGVECESLRVAIDQARAAVADTKAEEGVDLLIDGHLVIISSESEIVIVLPLEG